MDSIVLIVVVAFVLLFGAIALLPLFANKEEKY